MTYQINPAHTGAQSGDPLTPPLSRRWQVELDGEVTQPGYESEVSYPLIAESTVYVTVVYRPFNLPRYIRLYALDVTSGRSRWGPLEFQGDWGLAAYDAGRVFLQLSDSTLRAFDAGTGASQWRVKLHDEYASQAPPTAQSGVVYTNINGYVDAVSEATGAVLWGDRVSTGGSSPAVTSAGVYIGEGCANNYDLNPSNGSVIWHHTTSCQGGGGVTPVVWSGRMYARDPSRLMQDLVLDSSSGAEVGTFTAGPAPAFDGGTGFFLNTPRISGLPPRDGGTLEARDSSTGVLKWSFTGDGGLTSAPVVSGGYVYEASTNGWLYALDESTGNVVWSDRVSAGFPELPEGGQFPALAIGQGGLAAPFGSVLTFYTSAVATTPTAQPTSGPDTAVGYQLNPQHSGGQSTDPLRLPAKRLWASGLQGTPSYPLIVGGRIYVTLMSATTKLVAWNAANGSVPWPAIDLSTSWALPAYDNGRVYTISAEGQLRAFDAGTGTQAWQTTLSQKNFHSPPTAVNGSIYVSGRGDANGTLYAVDEATGAVRWSQNVAGGDDSAPLVTSTGVYVSYTCPQVYDFDPGDGHLIWHVGSPSCTPDAGRTPALFGGRLYVRDWHTNLILDPATGNQLGVFHSSFPLAFSGSMAFYDNYPPNTFAGGFLEGWDLATNSMVWRVDADDLSYGESAPVVVNGNVFQMIQGNLHAFDGRTGRQIWVGFVGAEPVASEFHSSTGLLTVLGGMAAGGGYIVVPAGGSITVFGTGGTVNPPTATPADASVSHQVDAAHTGGQPNDSLSPPLTQKWSVDLGGSVSFPVIAGDKVFVVVQPPGDVGPRLYALDRTTGRSVWGPVTLSDVSGYAMLAYDKGRVYVDAPTPSITPGSSMLRAFDAANGTEIWSKSGGNPVAGQSGLYVGASRIDEETGQQIWHTIVEGGGLLDDVTHDGVFLTSGCELAYRFSPGDGTIVWQHNATYCTTGAAAESVVYGGRLYMHEGSGTTQLVLDSATGAEVGTYTSDTTPAFAGNLAYFVVDHKLEAHNLPGLGTAWTFSGDGGLITAPVLVNGTVYVGSTSGTLYGLDAMTGTLRWSGNVGAAMSRPDLQFSYVLTGLGAGEGTLVVPAGTRLVAYVSGTPGPSPTPSPSPSPSSSPCTRVSTSASPPSPQLSGTVVTITASATGCPNARYQFWMLPPDGTWQLAQPYSASATFSWSTSGKPKGTYQFSIWARDAASSGTAGNSLGTWDTHSGLQYVLTSKPCTGVSTSTSPQSPQLSGTAVTITAAASGCPNPRYQFWLLPPGGSWRLAQAYSASATFNWSTTGKPKGTYQFSVWARDSSSTGVAGNSLGSWDTHTGRSYTLTSMPCTSVTTSANPASPQPTGAAVTITASATACPHALYEFWVLPPGGTWQLAQGYSADATFEWDTTGKPKGTYTFSVWARDASSTGIGGNSLGRWDTHSGRQYVLN